jgi:chemotaxis protein histidine kinase CheA
VSGRGVGLAAVQAEVTRLSGRIVVDSTPNVGTRFRIFVPAASLGLVQDH